MVRWIGLLAVIVAAAAFFTRPGPDDVETALRTELYQRILTADLDEGREMLGNAAIIACRIEPSACYELLRQGLDVAYENRWLYARVRVEGFGRRASCWGAFLRFWCPGGFVRAERSQAAPLHPVSAASPPARG